MDPKELGEKSHYTYDEMMAQLRQKKSRGRRRRTKQPKKRKSMVAKVILSMMLLLAILVGVAIVLIFMSRFRYEGEAFRRQVGERISELLGFEVEFSKFNLGGLTLSAQDARAEATGPSVVQEIDVARLSGDVSPASFFGDSWVIDPLQIYELSVVLGQPEAPAAEEGEAVSAPVPAVLEGGGFGLSADPETVTLGSVRVRETNVSWGDPAGPEAVSQIRQLGLFGSVFGSQVRFRGFGGTLEWGSLSWDFDSLTGEAEGANIDIDRARLTAGIRDELVITGKIALHPGGAASLRGTIQDLDLSLFVPEVWRTRLLGELDAAFDYNLAFTEGAKPALEGGFEMAQLGVSRLPVFDALAIFVAAPEFNFVEFHNVAGNFSWHGDTLTISDFDAHRPGLVRLRGEITVGSSGELGGTVFVGLPEATFANLGGVPELFRLREDGFAWAEMHLAGTLDQPSDDLSERLREGSRLRARAKIIEDTPDSVEPGTPSPTQVPADPGAESFLVPATPPEGAAAAPGAPESREDVLEKAFEELIR